MRTVYLCQECGFEHSKWSGQCSQCGIWNQLQAATLSKSQAPVASAMQEQQSYMRLSDVNTERTVRIFTHIGELDRVLGGGVVPGSITLLGGDPGIGKSTLLLQVAAFLGRDGCKVIYLAGEESIEQIAERAKRLKLNMEDVWISSEIMLESILSLVAKEKPLILIIDSVQTIYSEELNSATGSVAQVRECTSRIARLAKSTQISVFLVSHVTKEGYIAGPKVLEHMVDTVLYFEGDRGSHFRMLRANKNRFGTVNELAVFNMTNTGLREVDKPSAIFLSNHPQHVPGGVVVAIWSGSQPLLLEIQALTVPNHNNPAHRLAVGFEMSRFSMLLSVLQRYSDLAVHNMDIYLNVVGGLRLNDTSADLAIILSVLSSFKDTALPDRLVVFGEVGLLGEIRPVPNGPQRIMEAAKHGFDKVIAHVANVPKHDLPKGISVLKVESLKDVLSHLSWDI